MISMSSYLSFLVILDKTVEIHKLAAFLPAKISLFTIKIHCSKLPNICVDLPLNTNVYTTLTNISTKYLVVCKVYTDE